MSVEFQQKADADNTLQLIVQEKIHAPVTETKITIQKIVPLSIHGRELNNRILQETSDSFLTVMDSYGNTILDDSKSIEYSTPLDIGNKFRTTQKMAFTCQKEGGGQIKGTVGFGFPVTIPILPKQESDIIVKYSDFELVPRNGNYELSFSSMYETEINLPPNAVVLENSTRYCTLENGNPLFQHWLLFNLNNT